MYKRVAIVFALALSVPAHSQVIAPPAPPPIQPVDQGAAVLRVGTEVPLRLSEELTTKNKQLKTGQRFKMEVSEGVVVQGVTVIPVGSPAIGEVTQVRNKGMWGKSGYFSARVLYVTVNGRQIRLSGAIEQKGTAGGVGATATSVVVVPVAGFFITGTSAQLPIGTPIKGFVDEDVPLVMPAGGPIPLQVTVPKPIVAEPATPSGTGTPSSPVESAPAAAPAPSPAPTGN